MSNLAEVGEAVSEAHVADRAGDRHLSERFDRRLLFEERIVGWGEVSVRRVPDGVHVGLKVAIWFEPDRLRVFERHTGALSGPVQAELLVPAALQPDRRLSLEDELDDVVLRPHVVPEDEGDWMALIVRPPGHLPRREIAYRIVVHIVHLLEAGAYEGNGGHRALLSCDASPPHASLWEYTPPHR